MFKALNPVPISFLCVCINKRYFHEKVSQFIFQVREWVREKIPFNTIEERMKEIYEETKDGGFKWVPDIALSKCQISTKFCMGVCHALGRLNGTCTADKTDCECMGERVPLEQFVTCGFPGICKMKCKGEDKALGICAGKTGWECQCTDTIPEDWTNEDSLESYLGVF